VSPPRVLFVYRSDVDADGGAGTVMRETAKALRELGVEVDVTYDARPAVDGYDLVHAFNIWDPPTALAQLRYLRSTGLPVVWLPFYLHWCEFAWASQALRVIFGAAAPHERGPLLDAFAAGTLEFNGVGQRRFNEVYPGFHADLSEMLGCVDHVCAISHHEMQLLAQVTRLTSKPFTLTPHGVDQVFADASPDLFRERYGLDEFVLCVGAVDTRKNQLLLIEALRDTGLPLVLVGPALEGGYLEICRHVGGDRFLYLDRLPRELVASAYKAARVHALPSFAEGSALANLEAASAGCPIVVSNRSSEFEYFGDAPYYCDPADPASIRAAVRQAWDEGPREPERWQALSERMREYTWERTARATLAAYERVLATRPAAEVEGLRGFVALAFAHELIERPELLHAYRDCFRGDDDATLVILGLEPGLAEPLEAAVRDAGLDDEDGPDLLGLPLAPEDASETVLPRRVEAVLSRRAPQEPFAAAPRFDDSRIEALRALAERRWREAA
jgi:glycosyltransferase involved in cell wall biosynthesis